ncbi:ankyrin repeat domain-containing protein [Succinimonas sp.]|uniref:ankyrin repeat domain-containing protein n=1 Tax=Succinimonas sp. TaxID=1936151 RepID=UPI003867635F
MDHGADPNLYTSYENSILYLAARDNDAELLKKALARGASITPEGTESYLLSYFSLMYQKAYRGEDGSYSLDFIKAAVDAGGDINFESEDGKRTVAEQLFTRRSSPEIIAYWISLKPDLKKLKSWDKLKAEALKNWLDFKSIGEPRHLELTGKLFDLGVDPRVRDGNHLMLERAYEKGGLPYARLFLERGADPNAVNAFKAPLIFWAAETGNPDLLRLFKEFKADFNAVNDHGESVLYDVVSKDEPKMDLIAVLIENGANVNFTRVRNEKSVLMLAVSDRSAIKEQAVDLLLKNGANPNAANSRGRTALMMAVSEPKNPSLKVIESLLNAGAVIDTQDQDSATALSYAIASNHPGAARLLMEKGADPEKALAPGHEMKIGKGKDAKTEYKTLKDLVRETDKPELKELKELLAKYL